MWVIYTVSGKIKPVDIGNEDEFRKEVEANLKAAEKQQTLKPVINQKTVSLVDVLTLYYSSAWKGRYMFVCSFRFVRAVSLFFFFFFSIKCNMPLNSSS